MWLHFNNKSGNTFYFGGMWIILCNFGLCLAKEAISLSLLTIK